MQAMQSLWRRGAPGGRLLRRSSVAAEIPKKDFSKHEPLALDAWIKEHGPHLKPPVANRLLYGSDSDLKVMAVGGPNARSDYHVQTGEELFLQLQGELTLKIIEQGRKRDVVVGAGEAFLLPAHVPHSPQRSAGSIGLVFERSHTEDEVDGLFWLTEDSPTKFNYTRNVEYEEYFHCTDLGSQLKPIIERYEAWKGQWKPGEQRGSQRVDFPPIDIDPEVRCAPPTDVAEIFLELERSRDKSRTKALQNQVDEFIAEAHLGPKHLGSHKGAPFDIFVWQKTGSSQLSFLDTHAQHMLGPGDVMLIHKGRPYDCLLATDASMVSVANSFT
ncbi:3-hydroxyanthranilic acid dioxygenase-domain-containing protein [Pelagophyceae sp. CCMP2097]|nr:3-hydroxyanthranilic acid dioxygenase-domain-containing protein [Pelagophyceae sp. CCMP2097]|mmetsp:Transcript_6989/g.22687  ORF Transcript_6989/g.22687 Transcript_6989/m.22687 type:complete len:329 (+) Transcript_6989:63-1049(+)